MRAESAVLLISDRHTGKKTKTFDTDILADRMLNMANNTVKVIDILRKTYQIDKLYIFDLGDGIDNDSIFPNQSHHTDDEAPYGRAQVKKSVEIMKNPLRILEKEFDEVEYHGVPGNHGRVSKFTHEKNNWDLMYYDMLSLVVEKTKVLTHDEFYTVANVKGHGYLLTHGSGIRMYQSIPWYGITQKVMRWSGSIQEKFDVACFGHFHALGDMDWNDKVILLNGTAVTDDDWALEQIGMRGTNKYHLFGVHEDRPITWQYKIDLLG